MAQLLIEVLEQCRKGDKNAFEIIVKRFQNKALDLAKSIIRDKHLAEDAVQSAFLTAFCRLNQLRQAEAFAGWLRQIVRTEAIKIISRNSRDKKIVVDAKKQLSPCDNMELKELQQIIHRAFQQLPESSRQTAELFYLDEQSCVEVADALDVPAGTVKRRLYDARKKLRDVLGGYL